MLVVCLSLLRAPVTAGQRLAPPRSYHSEDDDDDRPLPDDDEDEDKDKDGFLRGNSTDGELE